MMEAKHGQLEQDFWLKSDPEVGDQGSGFPAPDDELDELIVEGDSVLDDNLVIEEDEEEPTEAPRAKWKILIVDDDEQFQQAIVLALSSFQFKDRTLEIITAQSGQSAQALVAAHPDLVLILLDVVMETNDAGLRVVKSVREDLVNKTVRLVLLTGQPGEAPQVSVIQDYHINDYQTKSDLTQEKLLTILITGIRSYCDIVALETSRQDLAAANQQLERFNQNLGNLVAQRTQELATKNQALEQEVTERKRAEAEAAQASQAKGRFLANMSHELRTPLNAIIGFAQLLQNDPDLGEKQQHHAGVINRSGEHLLAQINDILTISKIESGCNPLNCTSFNLHQLLADLQEMLALKAQLKGLRLVFDLAPDLPQHIYADEAKLRQVLTNLLSNALKFTKIGQVVLKAVLVKGSPCSEVTPPSPDCPDNPRTNSSKLPPPTYWLSFAVEDTGPGIAVTELDKLFIPFEQTQVGRRSQQGSGLGLSISQGFVQQMGGEITVTSRVDGGSCFQFELQVEGAKKSLAQTLKSHGTKVIALQPNQPAYRILVVDDSADSRALLVTLLSDLGFRVQEAGNGQEAIETWQAWNSSFDLDGYADGGDERL